jgi:hypothetical protein
MRDFIYYTIPILNKNMIFDLNVMTELSKIFNISSSNEKYYFDDVTYNHSKKLNKWKMNNNKNKLS